MGVHGEQVVLNRLRAAGIDAIGLETGWRVHRHPVTRKIVNATPRQKVLADIVGCRRGRMILIEVKTTAAEDDRLIWSRLEDHQVAGLDRWQVAGADVLVGWVRGVDVCLIPWRAAPGWGPRHALPWETAQRLAWDPAAERTAP